MRGLVGCVLCAGFLTVLPGCGIGFLYTHITTPLDLDLNSTPVVRDSADSDVKTFQYYIRIDWGSNAIGEIAKEHGFETVYYADLETLRVLGVWTQQYVHVYGTRNAP